MAANFEYESKTEGKEPGGESPKVPAAGPAAPSGGMPPPSANLQPRPADGLIAPLAPAAPAQPAKTPAGNNSFFPEARNQQAVRRRDAYTPDYLRRRRLTEYEKSLRRDANELEDDNLFDTENESLIQRQIRGRRKKAALPKRGTNVGRALSRQTWRKRYGVHARTKARLQKYKLGLKDLLKSVTRAFSGKRGGNKQT